MASLVSGRSVRGWRAALAAVLLFSMVVAPATASALVRGLPADGTVNGTITDPDGFGVRYACVYVFQPDGFGGWEMVDPGTGMGDGEWAQTDENGYFEFAIMPGTYRLKIQDTYGDYEWRDWMFVREFYNNRTTLAGASNVIVTSGLTVTCDSQVAIEEYGAGAGFITDASTGEGTYDVGVSFYRFDGVSEYESIQGSGSNSLGDWMAGGDEWSGIPAGSYKVKFEDDYGRYAPQWYGNTTFSASPTVTIAPTTVTSGINAAMARTSSIEGYLHGPQGGLPTFPAEDVMPIAYRWDAESGEWQEANDTGLQQNSDASGDYRIDGLIPGDYKIRFVPSSDNSPYWNRFYSDQMYGAVMPASFSATGTSDLATLLAQIAAGTTITVAAGTDYSLADTRLQYGSEIEGVVTKAVGGAVVKNYHVSVYDSSGLIRVADTWTLDDGTWRIRNLQAGGYKVKFDDESDIYGYSADPGFFYDTEWYKAGGNVATAATAELSALGVGSGAGARNAALDATLNWGNLEGTVTDRHQGKALEGMTVGLSTYDTALETWTEVDSTWTDSAGRYSFTKVPCTPADDVRVRAYEDDSEGTSLDIGVVYQETWFADADQGTLPYNLGVGITAGATVTADLAMPLKPLSEMDGVTGIGGIYGKVGADGSGSGTAGVPVNFYQEGGEGEWWFVGQKTTNAYGDYCTGLAEGNYRLQFGPTVALADEYYLNTTSFAAATPRTVVATPGAYVSVNASLGPAFTISGTVHDGSGAPLSGVEARAYAYDADWDVWAPVSYDEAYTSVGAAVAESDASGAYTIGGLKSGIAYRVGFSKWVEGDIYPPDWNRVYWRGDGGTAQSVDQATEVVLGPNQTGKDATLTAGAYMRGSLVDQGGKRVGQVHVKLWQKGPGAQWNQINSTYSSADGDFQFEGFGAGDYFMEFEDDTNFLYGHRWYRTADTSATATTITVAGGESRIVTATLEAVDTAYEPIFGDNRYETAANAAYEAFPLGADTVVISTGENWPDALGGSALAGAYDGPMLLVSKNSLPTAVANCIDDLGATKAIIIGGSGSVTTLTATQIASHVGGMGHVSRIAGGNRYETANLVAAATVSRLGSAYDGTAFMATGGSFPDALGASPLAASANWPIFLANPVTGLESATQAQMLALGVDHVLVLGGTSSVKPAVETSLNATFGDPNVDRLDGANRYETAAVIAEYGVDNVFGLGWNNVAFATGTGFPDALAGGVLQGSSGSVMLLTGATTLDASVATLLDDNKGTIAEVRFLGGTNSVSPGVRSLIYAHLN